MRMFLKPSAHRAIHGVEITMFQKSWDLENTGKYCQFLFNVWNYIYFMILDIKKTF